MAEIAPEKAKVDLRAVILAGGSGTRFWPLSRSSRPKQFLGIVGDKTMLEETVERLEGVIPPLRIYTVAGADQTKAIGKILRKVPEANLIIEPAPRNTAPSLILATAAIFLRDPRAVVLALPADHLVTDVKRYRRKIEAAARMATVSESIVTFGIPPTHPATGYGYIQFDRERHRRSAGFPFYRVSAFKEKPDVETARRFLTAGTYYWNSGIFLWRADVFGRMLERYAPDMDAHWKRVLETLQRVDPKALADAFEAMPSISIDYALMEKAQGILMAEGDFGWSDVGAWSSLGDIWTPDDKGNAVRGDLAALDAAGNIVYNPDRLTALVGVDDCVVVVTDDVVLVCRRDQDQRVREVVEMLKKSGRDKFL